MSNNNKQNNKIRCLAIISLIIALFGGIPGILGFLDYLNKSSIKIGFNTTKSISCKIDSSSKTLHEKPALLFVGINITGKGNHPSYIREVNCLIKCNGDWIEGNQFIPKQEIKTDENGGSMQAMHLVFYKNNDKDDIFFGGWKDFSPGQEGLTYGKPTNFSYACYFDLSPEEFVKATQIKIIVFDYLGNKYDENFNLSKLTKTYPRIVLMQG